MKIVVLYILTVIKEFIRQLYWLYNLTKVEFGKDKTLKFPIKIEGKGSIKFGNSCIIEKNVSLGVGISTKLNISNGTILEKSSTILIAEKGNLTILDNFKLGAHTRIYVNDDWFFGNDVKIETYCAIFSRESERAGSLKIGNGTHIGDFTIIDVVDDVIIGNEVAIGPNCTIYTHDHIYNNLEVPAWKGGVISKPITIEDGVWIGSNVTILPGVIIGKRTVVAAGSVVTKSLKGSAIYGGVPAKLIKEI